MSKLKVTTISDPDNDNTAISVDSSGNLTVPQNLTVSGTLSGDGSNLTGISTAPKIFFASMTSNYTVSHSTQTKVPMANEVIDTDNCYDASNYRFTPTTAGYYLLSFNVDMFTVDGWSYVATSSIYKNGSIYSRISNGNDPIWGANGLFHSVIVEANGTTDYFEPYLYFYDYSYNTSHDIVGSSQHRTFFQGYYLGAS